MNHLWLLLAVIVLPPGDEFDLVVRKSEQYSKRAEAIWETRSECTAPAIDVKELPQFERLAQEAQVWILAPRILQQEQGKRL